MSQLSIPDRLVLERTFTQADFDAFAELSGDDNPIHVDAAFAAQSRFGRTVAHGVMLYSVVRGMAALLVPDGQQASQQVMFAAPTYAGEPMRFMARVADRTAIAVTIEFEVIRIEDGEQTCSGTTTLVVTSEATA